VCILTKKGFFETFMWRKLRSRPIQAFHKTVTSKNPPDLAVKSDAVSVIMVPLVGATQQKNQAVLDVARRKMAAALAGATISALLI
jgi:hypothetical protein